MPDVEPVVESTASVVESAPMTTGGEGEPPLGGEASPQPHPLEPGGDRFKQVWARAKSAEDEAKVLKADLQREREERIRYEERLKAQEATPPKKDPVYTWTQLEDFITAGTLTRAQAAEYREGQIKQEADVMLDRKLEQRLQQAERTRTVTTDLDSYKALVPTIMQPGTPEREKVTREFQYMVQVLGMPNTVNTELAATRAALGDLDSVKRARSADTIRRDNLEATVETTTPGKTPVKGKDPIEGLDARQKDHYQRMIKAGRYKNGWDDVRKELTWTRGSKK